MLLRYVGMAFEYSRWYFRKVLNPFPCGSVPSWAICRCLTIRAYFMNCLTSCSSSRSCCFFLNFSASCFFRHSFSGSSSTLIPMSVSVDPVKVTAGLSLSASSRARALSISVFFLISYRIVASFFCLYFSSTRPACSRALLI